MDNALLEDTLAVAVPLEIERQKKLPWVWVEAIARASGELIAGPAGADLLYKSKKPGETAKAFAAVARGLAALSFCPGGVRFLSLHFESRHPGLPDVDPSSTP